MNKHVPPPVDDKVRSVGRAAFGGESGVSGLAPAHTAEAKSPPPSTQPEQRQPEKPQPADGDGQPKTSKPPAEETTPLSRAFWTRPRLGIAGVIAMAVLGAVLWPWGGSEPKIAYSFTKVAYGNVTLRVSSVATLEPRDAVDVVAQIGGRVDTLPVKSGDRVAKGQPLAHLISESALDELVATQAELAARQADLARAEADVMEARAAVLRARNDTKSGAIDSAEARFARAEANANESHALLRAGEVSLVAARAAVENLDIRAPFDGIVLKTNLNPQRDVRAVTRGQSVITMAGDLSQLNLRADFPESALGTLHLGARAEFTAPAFPQQRFAATLTGIDAWPKRESRDGRQIVIYTGTLTGDNPNGVLRPGMSANVAVIVAEARNVLVVPNTALTFVPPLKIEAQFPPPKASSGARIGRVWVLAGGSPEPRDVSLGLSDARVTQVVAGSLRAGENVITSALIAAGTRS
jgi:HlyD family secretion protein